MTHSHDVQKIHTHYLAPSSRRERCEFTAALELWPAVTFSTWPVPLPVCRAETSQAQKVVRRIYFLCFLVFLLLKLLIFLFLDNY